MLNPVVVGVGVGGGGGMKSFPSSVFILVVGLQLVKIPSFWVLLVVWGSASGMFNAFLTLLPQLLCPYGYSDVSVFFCEEW